MSVDLSQRISVTRGQAAELVGLSKDTIARACRSGDLPEHYVASTPLILIDDLRAWVSEAPTTDLRRSP